MTNTKIKNKPPINAEIINAKVLFWAATPREQKSSMSNLPTVNKCSIELATI